MTGNEFVVKVERLAGQLDSFGHKLQFASAGVKSHFMPFYNDVIGEVEKFQARGRTLVENDAMGFNVSDNEAKALDDFGARVAVLLQEIDTNISADQAAQALDYAQRRKIGMDDLIDATEDQFAALQKITLEMEPTMSDLAKASAGEIAALRSELAYSEPGKFKFTPLMLLAGVAVAGAVFYARQRSSRTKRAPAPKRKRRARVRVKGKLRVRRAKA